MLRLWLQHLWCNNKYYKILCSVIKLLISIEAFLSTQISILIKGKYISFLISLALSSPQSPCYFEDLASASCWYCTPWEKISSERKKKRGSRRRGDPLYTSSFQESNLPLAPNSNFRTLGMHLIYLSSAKSMKRFQKCGWNEPWWITILSKRLRMSRTNCFFHKKEKKDRNHFISIFFSLI